jgi:outer membrane protein assembly factor BamB
MKIVILVLLLASCVFAQTPTDQNGSLQVALVGVDRIGEATARSFFVFTTGVRNYVLRYDGHSEASQLANYKGADLRMGMRKNFDLRMGGAVRLERVYFAEFEGDLILEYEVKDQKGDAGYILRMDQKTMRFKWITPVSRDSLGPGLIDQHDLYITGSNLLAKVDLQNGTYLWQQAELGRFYSFSVPAIKGDAILFRDESKTDTTIEVEKQTGRLIKH